MIYQWKDIKTNKQIEVDRPMSDSDLTPTLEESITAGLTEKEYKHAEFIKIVTGGSFSRTFGMKGQWIALTAMAEYFNNTLIL